MDTGNPDFFISRELALEMRLISNEDSLKAINGKLEIITPAGIKIGEMELDFSNVQCYFIFEPFWLFKATHADANLPSTVLIKYDVDFDYYTKEMTISKLGTMKFTGIKIPININPETGILQIDGMIGSDSISFALDNGASFTFGSTEFLESLKNKNPNLTICNSAVGYANIWGWGFKEASWTVTRIPQINFGNLILKKTGITIPPDFNDQGFGLMDWYSKKTAMPVEGFLGPNVLKDYSIGIDYLNKEVYFDKKGEYNSNDLDIIGITLRPGADVNYSIIGLPNQEGIPVITGIKLGDTLLQIDELIT